MEITSDTDVTTLLETSYATERPELLSMYHIDIESEALDGSWHGKLWKEREDVGAYPFMAVSNANTGSPNRYLRITSLEDKKEFFEASRLAFPQHMEPEDTACVYLELRQAKQDEEAL